MLSEETKKAWDTALTLAHNYCVQVSDNYNGDDKIEEAQAANECAKTIRSLINDYKTLELVLKPEVTVVASTMLSVSQKELPEDDFDLEQYKRNG